MRPEGQWRAATLKPKKPAPPVTEVGPVTFGVAPLSGTAVPQAFDDSITRHIGLQRYQEIYQTDAVVRAALDLRCSAM